MYPAPLFIVLLALVLFLIALLRTNIALNVLILSMLLSPEFNIGGIPGRAVVVRIDDIFLFVVFFGWMAKLAINKELGVLKFTSLNRPILTYLSIGIFSTLLAAIGGYGNIKYGFFYLLKYMEYFLLFFMVVNNLKTIGQTKVFVFFILLTCFLVCLYAWLQIGTVYRVTAPFEGEAGEANTLAGYLLLMMGIVIGFILYTESIKQRVILLVLLGLIVIPFLFTLSRGTWVAFFPMSLSLLFITRRKKGVVLLSLLMIIMLAPFVMPENVRDRIASTFVPTGKTYSFLGSKITVDESASTRIDSWKYALKMWAKKPILGYGIPAGIVTDNQYARVLREVGLIGFIAYIWLMVRIFKVGWRSYNLTKDDNFAQGLSLGFTVGFIGLLTQALSVETFIIIRIMEPFWFLTAIVITLPEISIRFNSKRQ